MQPSEPTPLTTAQIPLWFGQQQHPDSPLYNMAFLFVFETRIDPVRFGRAFDAVVAASDVLNVAVVEIEGAPHARRAATPPTTDQLNLAGERDPEAALSRWAHDRARHPLRLDAPLVDSVLIDLGDGRSAWYLNQHHLVTDATSTVHLYRAVAAGYADPADAGNAGPAYFSTAAASVPATDRQQRAEAHWRERTTAMPRLVALYGKRNTPTETSNVRRTLILDEARSRAIDDLATSPGFRHLSRDLSRFAVFATLFAAYLRTVSGAENLAFDTPVAGRSTRSSREALGPFLEMFPFGLPIAAGDTFRSVGGRCLEEAHEQLRHALPGSSATAARDPNNVVLNFVPVEFGDFAGVPTAVEWIHPGHADSVHALRLQVHDFGGTGRYTLHFDGNTTTLSNLEHERALTHLETMLTAMLDDPDREIDSIDVRTNAERQALEQVNDTGNRPLPAQSVVAKIYAFAAQNQDREAVRQGEERLTFGELCERADALAQRLVQRGVQPGDRVATRCPRSLLAVIAVLGTMRARAAWVPVDPSYPAGRADYIIADSGARVLLVADDPASPATDESIDVVSIEAASQPLPTPSPGLLPELGDLAYLIYTSGSTGRPKGTLVEHGGLADYVEWAARRYVRGDELAFPLFTSLSFDLTITSLFLPLTTGGRLLIYAPSEASADTALVDVLRDDAVDFIKLTPSHLALLTKLGARGSRLRRMVVGGEDLSVHLASTVQAEFDGRLEIHNEYGPTEAIVGCVVHQFDPSQDRDGSVPIGAPADHVQIAIKNARGTPVPDGTPGELWISRHGLARGYHGQPELTNERFLADDSHWQRSYRTGDLVRFSRPGQLTYLGRCDRQLKISGFRIEPAEIESVLLDDQAIQQCAVVVRTNDRTTIQSGLDASKITSGEDLHRCERCGLASNYPRATFDDAGICNVCRSYERIKDHAQAYFRTIDDLRQVFDESRRSRAPQYDCMMLLSGGKDSTYALCQLVDMGLSVYAFTLDNGFIAERAKENIRRATGELGVPVEFASTSAMNSIFRDSLSRFANVCQGCFKTIYTLATNRAKELGIPIIVTGLSRGQMFETRLTEDMFEDGKCSPAEVDAAVLAARKVYHRVDDEVARTLDVGVFQDDAIFDEVRFLDFYRYCDVGLSQLYSYLGHKIPWQRPEDSGRSTNCLINDVGIWVHKQERGFHNYALPYSWDVRLGHKTRDEALQELDDLIDEDYVRETLATVGYDRRDALDARASSTLAAFYVATDEVPATELRERLLQSLPSQFVPSEFHRLDQLPLTPHGKLDEAALPWPDSSRRSSRPHTPPEGEVEEFLAELWQTELGIEQVGREDSYFELGGTSLLGMDVMIRLCREFDIDLPLETLFAHPTLAELARIAEDRILADVEALEED